MTIILIISLSRDDGAWLLLCPHPCSVGVLHYHHIGMFFRPTESFLARAKTRANKVITNTRAKSLPEAVAKNGSLQLSCGYVSWARLTVT